jgi:hypothetical protein
MGYDGIDLEKTRNLKMFPCSSDKSQLAWFETTGKDNTNRLKYGDKLGRVRCVELDGSHSRGNVRVAPCTAGDNQKFYFDPKRRMLSKTSTSYCVDYYVGSKDVKMWDCHNGRNQQWSFKTAHDIAGMKLMEAAPTKLPGRNFFTGYLPSNCMAWTNTNNNIKMEKCDGRSDQLFFFYGSGASRAVKSKKDNGKMCLDYHYHNMNVYMHPCHYHNNQKFVIDGLHRLVSAYDGKCVEYNKKGGNVFMNKCNTGSEQQWFMDVKKAVNTAAMADAPKSWVLARNFVTAKLPAAGLQCLKALTNKDIKVAPCDAYANQKFYFHQGFLKSAADQGRNCAQFRASDKNLVMATCTTAKREQFYIDELIHVRTKEDDVNCVDFRSSDSGAIMSPCNGEDNQRWHFMSKTKMAEMHAMHGVPRTNDTATNFYTLFRPETCMEIKRGTSALGMDTCTTIPEAHFYIDKEENLRFQNDESKRCAEQKKHDQSLFMYPCKADNNNQKFIFDGAKRLTSREDKRCVEYNRKSGNLMLNECHGGDEQRWYYGNHAERIQKPMPATKDAARGIVNRDSGGKCIEMNEDTNMVTMQTCAPGRKSQRFYYIDNQIKSYLGNCLDFNLEDFAERNLHMSVCRGNATAQMFFFERENVKTSKLIFANSCMDVSKDGYVYIGSCNISLKSQRWHFEENKPISQRTGPQINHYSSACETVDPSEETRMYSSVYGGDNPGTGHAQSMLASTAAWSAQYSFAGEWVQLDLGSRKDISGVVLAGRKGQGEWITAYRVSLSNDGLHFSAIPGVFDGGKDDTAPVYGTFVPEFARYVRIIIEAWEKHLSGRFGVLVCRPKGSSAAALAEMTNTSILLKPAASTHQMSHGCYVYVHDCPNQDITFKEWTRDLFGEKYKNASHDQEACLRTRKVDHNTFCGIGNAEMMFVPKPAIEYAEL